MSFSGNQHNVTLLCKGNCSFNCFASINNSEDLVKSSNIQTLSHIYQYVDKPWDNDRLAETIGGAANLKLENDEKERATASLLEDRERWTGVVKSLTSEIDKRKDGTINALLKVLMVKDHELYLHSKRVADIAVRLARAMGYSDEARERLWLSPVFVAASAKG